MPVRKFEPGQGGMPEFIRRLHQAEWEPVLRALPDSLHGPAFRARVAIEFLVVTAMELSCREAGDTQRAAMAGWIDGVLAKVTGRDHETFAAMMLIRKIEADANIELRKSSGPHRAHHFERMWPEYELDETAYRKAVEAWIAYEATRQGSKWGPVLAAVRSAGLAKRMTQRSLERKWREWREENPNL